MPNARIFASSCGAVCAALVAGSLGAPSVVFAQPEAVVGAGSGLSAPAAVVRAPDGGIWVADELRGVCRVSFEAEPKLVESAWCGPAGFEEEDAVEEGAADGADEVDEVDADGNAAETDLAPEPEPADVNPGGRLGPGDPSGLAFDEQTGYFYASDRASSGGAIWRLQWDPSTGAIDGGEVIASTSNRIEAMTLGLELVAGEGRDVFYVAKRSAAIMRVADPATDPQPPPFAGTVVGDGAYDIAATEDALYVADGGLTRYRLDPAVASVRSEPVPGFEGSVVTAVTNDPARSRLYVGTSNPDLEDVVKAVDLTNGRVENYELGFTGVTALGVEPDGQLLVADDPIVATGAEATMGEGRLWRVALEALKRPEALITAAPPRVSSLRDVSFSYASRAGAAFECRLDDGEYVVTYECSVDDAPYAACWSGNALENLGAGAHVLRVIGVDEAGNASDPASPSAAMTLQIRARTRPSLPSIAPENVTSASPSSAAVPAPVRREPPVRCPSSPSRTCGRSGLGWCAPDRPLHVCACMSI